MKKIFYLTFAFLAFIIIMILGCGISYEKGEIPDSDKTIIIAVIPKGITHEFWKSIHAVAIKASREMENFLGYTSLSER